MGDDAKNFVLGLELSRVSKGMKWHGKIPEEIKELYQLPQDFKAGGIAGIYVVTLPQSEPFTPEWLEGGSDGKPDNRA